MTGRNIRTDDWQRHVAGYFVGVDVVNHGLLGKARADGSPWCLSKGSDGFAAVSDFVSVDQIKDCTNLSLKLIVNGEIR